MIKLAKYFVYTLAGFVVLLLSCQSKLIYHPRGYSSTLVKVHGSKEINFVTSQGKQSAWLTTKQQSETLECVWLVFAGNGSLALDFVDYFQAQALSKDAFVMVDYPSYGRSEGSPSPAALRETVRSVVPPLAKKLGLEEQALLPKLRVFGHSLGAAVALLAMEENHIQGGVLVAPFTSMKDMAKLILGWPLCEALHHRYNNVATLQRLHLKHPTLHVIHGTQDEVIPFSQGQTLSTLFPNSITFHPAEGASHNGILQTEKEAITNLLLRVRIGL